MTPSSSPDCLGSVLMGAGSLLRAEKLAELGVRFIRSLLGRVVAARERHAADQVLDVARPALLVAVELRGMALTADDHEHRARDLVPCFEVLLVHLEVDRGRRAIILAHAVDVPGRAAAHVLADRILGEAALAQSLGAELEADVILL